MDLIASRPRAFAALAALGVTIGVGWFAFTAWEIRNSATGQDIGRQWLVAHYATKRVDPYRVSLNALQEAQGDGPRKRVSTIPQGLKDPAAAGVLPGRPVPEATYPPFAIGLLAVTFAWLPKSWVLWAWTALTATMVVLLPRVLAAAAGVELRTRTELALVLALVLLWPPIEGTVYWGQFGLVVFFAALVGFATPRGREVRAGLWLSLVLVKPSLGLPFLIAPLVEGRWIVLLTVGVVHAAGTLIVTAFTGVAPWTLVSEWVSVSGHFLGRGMYTLEELIVRSAGADTAAGTALTVGGIGAAFLWLAWQRRKPAAWKLAFIACVSTAWMYHMRYDFVVLLFPLVLLLFGSLPGRRGAGIPPWARIAGFVAFTFVGVSLLGSVYGGDDAASRALRWAGRLSFGAIFFGSAWLLAMPARSENPATTA